MSRIGEIYHCSSIKKQKLTALEIWYNQIIEKDYEEIELSDILRMIRQKVFVDIAVRKSIDYLKQNPIVGEMFDGELLEELYSEKTKQYFKYKEEMLAIVKAAEKKITRHNWLIEEERDAYYVCLKNIKEELSASITR